MSVSKPGNNSKDDPSFVVCGTGGSHFLDFDYVSTHIHHPPPTPYKPFNTLVALSLPPVEVLGVRMLSLG